MFTAAAVGAAVASLPAFAATLRGSALDRLLALQVVSADVSLLFALVAGERGTAFDLDLALTVGVLSFVGALALVRFMGGRT